MKGTTNFVAVDLGASGGRVVVARWDGQRFALQEVHRFANAGVKLGESLHWDVLRLWSEINTGLEKHANMFAAAPAAISVDTWGVDFALLDRCGHLVGNPHHYRDPRTHSAPEQVFARITSAEMFQRTGIQPLSINTIFQLYSMVAVHDARLEAAESLLMMPDLFHFWLCGDKRVEYTIASTTQMLDCRQRQWAGDAVARAGIPTRLLGPIVNPGTVLAEIRTDVARQCGLASQFPVIAGAGHDTAGAVAAIPYLDDDSAYISSGTWSLMGVETQEPVTSAEALSLGFSNEGGVGGTIRLLRNIAGLWLLQECVRHWQRAGRGYSWDEVVRIASSAAPLRSLIDPDAAEFHAPENMPAAVRDYCRRTGQPLPDDDGTIARCCLEGLSLKYRWVLETLQALIGRELNTIRMVGGGSRNALLCQLAADACQRAVVAGPVEASALGNAMVQAVATGHLDSISAGRECIAASSDLVFYEPHYGDQWDDAYDRFCRLEGLQRA